jgi:hypothetical protein
VLQGKQMQGSHMQQGAGGGTKTAQGELTKAKVAIYMTNINS